MRYLVVVVFLLALVLPTQAQFRGRGMPSRGMGGGMVRPMPSPGFRAVPRGRMISPGPRFAVRPRFGGNRQVFTSRPFVPFVHPRFNRFSSRRFNPFFFRGGFCFSRPQFCNGLFFRNALFGFGAFDTFGAFPVYASAYPFYPGYYPAYEYQAPAYADTQARMEQQNAAIADLSSQLEEERQTRRELEDEVARLRSPAWTQNAPQNPGRAAAALLVFKDGRQSEVENYAIVGHTIYAFEPQWSRKIAVADLDVPATVKANAGRGIVFRLPQTGQMITHP